MFWGGLSFLFFGVGEEGGGGRGRGAFKGRREADIEYAWLCEGAVGALWGAWFVYLHYSFPFL